VTAAPKNLLTLAAGLVYLCLALPASALAIERNGGPGAETLRGTAGPDRLNGGGGDDKLLGLGGADVLRGGVGEDRLKGHGGRDRLLGGPGDDLILARDGQRDIVSCGPGDEDVAVVDATDRVRADCERVLRPAAPQSRVPVQPAPAPAGPPAPGVTTTPPPTPEEPEKETPEEEPTEEGGYEEVPLAVFAPGHGWTGNGVGTFTNTGGPFAVNGNQSFKIETPGNGNGQASVATSPLLGPLDIRNHHISFHSQVSFSNRLGEVRLRLSSAGDFTGNYAEATVWREGEDPIALGSTFEFQSLALGGFSTVGTVDWSKVNRAQILLTDKKTVGEPVSLYNAGVYAVPTSKKATISFAFDDGFASTYSRGLKKLSTYRFPATTYVVADAVGDPNQMSLEQLYALRNQHHWEIAGHAFAMSSHNLSSGLDSLEPAALEEEFDQLRAWLDAQGFARRTFAYPKGAAGTAVRKYVARDYCAGRATAGGPETVPPRDPFTLRGWSLNRTSYDADAIKQRIDAAVAQGTWLMLSFHDLVATSGDLKTNFDYTEAAFAEVVDHVRGLQQQGKLRVRTVADAVGC
jgi:hypothetical protein